MSQSLEVAIMLVSLRHSHSLCLRNSRVNHGVITGVFPSLQLRYRKKILHRKRSISASQQNLVGSSPSRRWRRWRAPRVVKDVKAKAACQRWMDATQGHPISISIIIVSWLNFSWTVLVKLNVYHGLEARDEDSQADEAVPTGKWSALFWKWQATSPSSTTDAFSAPSHGRPTVLGMLKLILHCWMLKYVEWICLSYLFCQANMFVIRLLCFLLAMILWWQDVTRSWISISYFDLFRDFVTCCKNGFPVKFHCSKRTRRLRTCSIICQENKNGSVPEWSAEWRYERRVNAGKPDTETPEKWFVRAHHGLACLQGMRLIPPPLSTPLPE